MCCSWQTCGCPDHHVAPSVCMCVIHHFIIVHTYRAISKGCGRLLNLKVGVGASGGEREADLTEHTLVWIGLVVCVLLCKDSSCGSSSGEPLASWSLM